MPSDGCEFAFSSRVPPKALTIKIPYTSWNYQSKVSGTSTVPLIPDDPLITTNTFYTYEYGARTAVEFFVDPASKTPVHFKFERALFMKQ
jgi:hypothetical protein